MSGEAEEPPTRPASPSCPLCEQTLTFVPSASTDTGAWVCEQKHPWQAGAPLVRCPRCGDVMQRFAGGVADGVHHAATMWTCNADPR